MAKASPVPVPVPATRPTVLPVPEPKPDPPPPISLADIPTGDPALVATQLLGRLRKGLVNETRDRLDRTESQIGDLLELGRTSALRLSEFIAQAIPLVYKKDALSRRAAILAGREPPAPVDVPAAVFELVWAVRRYRHGQELRTEWLQRAGDARRDLERVRWELGCTLRSADGEHASETNSVRHKKGLYATSDVWIERAEEQLGRRQDILARMERLGESVEARSAAVKSAVKGIRDELLKALADRVVHVVPDHGPRVRALDAQLDQVDPDSRQAAKLREEIARLSQEVKDAIESAAAVRDGQAAGFLKRAEAGDLDAIGEVERLARESGLAELAGTLADLRGTPAQFEAVVSELVAEAEAKLFSTFRHAGFSQ